MTVQELVRALVGAVDAAGFDVGRVANAFGYLTGELLTRHAQTDEAACEYEPGYRHENIKHMMRVSRAIAALGFTVINYGYFSTVFKHPDAPEVVFKLSMRTDDAYAAFALWARNAPDEHAPVFYDMQRGKQSVAFAIKEYISISQAQIMGYLPQHFSSWDLVGRSHRYESNSTYRQSLVQYVKSIMKFFHGVATVDIYGDNLMYDPETKQVIVTDPVSFTNPLNKENQPCSSINTARSST